MSTRKPYASFASVLVLVTILVGSYITAQIVADIAAVKLLSFNLPGGVALTLPAGTFIFAFTFTLKDFIQKRLGKSVAQAAVVMAVVANVFLFLYMKLAVVLTPAVFWPFQDQFAVVYDWLPRIVAASILAELISETADVQVYSMVRKRFGPVGRIFTSNLVSTPLDSIVFEIGAFAGIIPLPGILLAIVGQTVVKLILSMAVAPVTYIIPDEEIQVEALAL